MASRSSELPLARTRTHAKLKVYRREEAESPDSPGRGDVARTTLLFNHGKRKGGRTAATDTKQRSNILILVGTRPEAGSRCSRSCWRCSAARGSLRSSSRPVSTGPRAADPRPRRDRARRRSGGRPSEADAQRSRLGRDLKLDAVCRDRFQATGETIATRDQVRRAGSPPPRSSTATPPRPLPPLRPPSTCAFPSATSRLACVQVRR